MTDHAPRRVFITHNACLNAAYDVNLVGEGLKRSGVVVVAKPEDADEIVFSGCSVRDRWVQDAAQQIRNVIERAPLEARVVVTGCVAATAAERLRELLGPLSARLSFRGQDALLQARTGLTIADVDRTTTQNSTTDFEGIRDLHGLPQVRRRVGPEKAEVLAALQKVDREFGTDIEQIYRSTTKGFVFYNERDDVEFVTVTRSCPYRCSFCSIPTGRGPFTSVPLPDVLAKVTAAIGRGVRRFVLIGDEVGNYGAGTSGPKLPELLMAVLGAAPDLRVSIRYIEPKPLLKHLDLIDRMASEGRLELLYVSVQSGSQDVLNRMNRNYRLPPLADALAVLRRKVIVYSNWLVGFPGETEADVELTRSIMKDLDLHINVAIPFSARPDTAALAMEGHHDEAEIARRVATLSQTAAAMKGRRMSAEMSSLPAPVRDALVQRIIRAELSQYADPDARPEVGPADA